MSKRNRRRRATSEPRVDLLDVAGFLRVRTAMGDLRQDLHAARYRAESALLALEEGDSGAVTRHLSEVQRALEEARRRTRLPEEVFQERLFRS